MQDADEYTRYCLDEAMAFFIMRQKLEGAESEGQGSQAGTAGAGREKQKQEFAERGKDWNVPSFMLSPKFANE